MQYTTKSHLATAIAVVVVDVYGEVEEETCQNR